jgi:hypothetical protein
MRKIRDPLPSRQTKLVAGLPQGAAPAARELAGARKILR